MIHLCCSTHLCKSLTIALLIPLQVCVAVTDYDILLQTFFQGNKYWIDDQKIALFVSVNSVKPF